MIAQIGETYFHYKNKRPYKVLDFCRIQENDVWVEAVIYEDEQHDKYVRSDLEFCTKFLSDLS